MLRRLSMVAGALALMAGAAHAQTPDTTARVTFGAFIDSYYAWDFGRPPGHQRALVTQAARHDEFAINLAHVEARYQSSSVRGRLAVQAGTSMQVNYAGEPDSLGGVTNFFPHVQEAYAGVAVTPALWIDAGIFLSHVGSESWISADNPVYTRSLPSELAPYYQTGVRATWQATPALTAQLNLLNGWQNISENNGSKAAGLRLDWTASSALTVSYANFLGRERHGSTGDQGLRVLNDVSARWSRGPATLVGTVDVGTQEGDTWYAASLLGRWWVTPTVGINGRVERFDDRDGVIVPLRTNGASVGVDVARGPALWRTELRTFFGSPDPFFPDRDGDEGLSDTNTAIVTSLSVRL
ncbi:MAG TPA: outer membrane beta-barrel protein [Longimicrobium sp.]|nr:outer membrane beta-barrel protein [Longimicrobium sp.]